MLGILQLRHQELPCGWGGSWMLGIFSLLYYCCFIISCRKGGNTARLVITDCKLFLRMLTGKHPHDPVDADPVLHRDPHPGQDPGQHHNYLYHLDLCGRSTTLPLTTAQVCGSVFVSKLSSPNLLLGWNTRKEARNLPLFNYIFPNLSLFTLRFDSLAFLCWLMNPPHMNLSHPGSVTQIKLFILSLGNNFSESWSL